MPYIGIERRSWLSRFLDKEWLVLLTIGLLSFGVGITGIIVIIRG